MIAEIIINSNVRALDKVFDYIVPKEMENQVHIGSRIYVQFGNGKKLDDGFIINLKEKSEFANKEIVSINNKESLTENNITLAKLMARKYFCNLSECIRLMLPPGTASKEEGKRTKEKLGNFVFLNKTKEEIDFLIETGKLKSEKHIKVAKFLLENNDIYISDLEEITCINRSVFKTMKKNGIIEIKEGRLERNPFFAKNVIRDSKKELTDEQKECFYGISEDIEFNKYSKNLIFGVTGSGKTEIYLQLIEKIMEKRKECYCTCARDIFNSSNGR